MQQAMQLANAGDFPAAVEKARCAWETSRDARVGFSLVQLLEQAAAVDPAAVDPAGGPMGQWVPHTVEAAAIARRLMKAGERNQAFCSQLPAVVWREAEMLARIDDGEAAFRVLAESFACGWYGFDEALASPAFAALNQQARLENLVSAARNRLREKLKDESRREMACFRRFAFPLATDDIEANPLSLDAMRGHVVLVHFWGTWCPLCCEQIRGLNGLQKTYAGRLDVVGLAFETPDPELGTEIVRQAMLKHEIGYRCALGQRQWQEQVPGFAGFPTFLVVDPQGVVRLVVSGPQPAEKMESVVQLLLDENCPLPQPLDR